LDNDNGFRARFCPLARENTSAKSVVIIQVRRKGTAMPTENLLSVVDLKKYFPLPKTSLFSLKKRYLKAAEEVSFDIKKGEIFGLVGESGCGKSTLGRTLLQLYRPTSGQVLYYGREQPVDLTKITEKQMRTLRKDLQIIFQDPYSSLNPRMTVSQIIGEGAVTHGFFKRNSEELKAYVLDVMKKCGLQAHMATRYPHEFSGGQRQRICIAKALALKPKLVICDEPVSALDVSIQAQVINLFKDLQEKDNLAYIFISHDLSVVEHISDEVGVMYLGNMVEFGPKEELFENPMHPYTKSLFSAVPVPDPDVKMNRIILKGDIPSPANPPSGCKFHTRCSQCMDICKEVEPKFKDYGNGHCVACHLYSQED
jgi:oligopeptide/dipeptide ABC transporter ATP-binding protein